MKSHKLIENFECKNIRIEKKNASAGFSFFDTGIGLGYWRSGYCG